MGNYIHHWPERGTGLSLRYHVLFFKTLNLPDNHLCHQPFHCFPHKVISSPTGEQLATSLLCWWYPSFLGGSLRTILLWVKISLRTPYVSASAVIAAYLEGTSPYTMPSPIQLGKSLYSSTLPISEALSWLWRRPSSLEMISLASLHHQCAAAVVQLERAILILLVLDPCLCHLKPCLIPLLCRPADIRCKCIQLICHCIRQF